MEKKDNIATLYHQLNSKSDFIKEVALHFNKRPNTLRHHWFSESGFWSVPSALEDEVIKMLQNKILLQNQLNKAV